MLVEFRERRARIASREPTRLRERETYRHCLLHATHRQLPIGVVVGQTYCRTTVSGGREAVALGRTVPFFGGFFLNECSSEVCLESHCAWYQTLSTIRPCRRIFVLGKGKFSGRLALLNSHKLRWTRSVPPAIAGGCAAMLRLTVLLLRTHPLSEVVLTLSKCLSCN